MKIKKQEIPLLEYDNNPESIIDPIKLAKKTLADSAVITFFNDIVNILLDDNKIKKIYTLKSEMGDHNIYEFIKETDKEDRILLFHPGVGAPLAAGFFDELVGLGVKYAIVCGGAGVLNGNIDRGNVIIPVKAVRDEGLSYHYLPPSRYVEPCSKSIPIIESVLKSHSIPFLKGNTWTTDAIFRETKEKIKLRREIDSCLTVEMEASALFAVAKFRKVHLGQILYAGDDVSGEEWDNRDWLNIKSVREKLILVSKEIVKELKNDIENK